MGKLNEGGALVHARPYLGPADLPGFVMEALSAPLRRETGV
ncbi:hypothetical protein EMEDMD4_440225 [Sinorhizobium medicae]|uniref:Uncharacterized protein n=1 Tax=Sinorhizobium medicae TaxID=110321 RepID=A0A508X1U7_9HYPH|nr:hypothetical protein EMEDMD4_440225 [Sinorhizobium medicae]